MTNVYLIDGSAETALTSFDNDLFLTLLAGRQQRGKIDRFDTSKLPFNCAACVEFFNDEKNESENLTQTLIRRVLPKFTQLPAINTIIWAGVKGNAEFIENGAWSGVSTCSFPYLPRHYSHWVRNQLGFENAKLIEVGAACASSTLGIAIGADLIVSGRSKSVLVVAADIVTRFSFIGFSALYALSPSVCRPFDVNRDGLMLGDGAVAVLLAGEDYVKDLEVTPLARISGWGVANDAEHITAPAPDGRGLISAMTLAMKKANIKPRDIMAFCAHGTGTVPNDAMELTAIEAVFSDRYFPVFSVKGALGHTSGAAGGIEALICAKALASCVVPPTAGLKCPEPKSHGRVSFKKQEFDNKNIMTSNSGFGGVNVVLILENVNNI